MRRIRKLNASKIRKNSQDLLKNAKKRVTIDGHPIYKECLCNIASENVAENKNDVR